MCLTVLELEPFRQDELPARHDEGQSVDPAISNLERQLRSTTNGICSGTKREW